MAYRIRDWVRFYETHETRKLVNLKWVPIPNRHDGAGFRRLAERKDCCELFSAWVLLLEIASKAECRGDLPALPEDAGYKTGFPARIFYRAYEVLSKPEIGWIEIYGENAISPEVPAESPGRREGNGIEGNGIEGKRKRESKARAHAFHESEFFDITVLKLKLAGWTDAKIEHYWNAAKDGCEAKGYKYLDWSATIRNWARMDEQRGKPFQESQSGPSISEQAEAIRKKYGR